VSIFNNATVACGSCGTEQPVKLASSVNVDRRPDLRQAILDGSFQAETCVKCAATIRIPSSTTYMDSGRGQWIVVDQISKLSAWGAAETFARGLFESTYGPDAPQVAQEIGEGLTPRLVFGWPALREKLVATDQSVADLSLEIMKMEILRSVPKPPLASKMELRLTGGTPEELQFTWIDTDTEAAVNILAVPRSVYEDIDDQPEDWYELREKFDGALFVDMTRLLVPAA